MVMIDVFSSNAFHTVSLSTAIQDMEYQPAMLGTMGIFTPRPIRTKEFAIERKGHNLRLIQTDQRGAPRQRQTRDRRNIRNFSTDRLSKADELTASELLNVRAFGSETDEMAAASELALRQSYLRQDLEYTEENHRLGAIDGLVMDADGTSVVNDWYDEWGIVRPAALNFDWATRTNNEEFVNQNVIRPIVRSLGGRFVPGASFVALCGGGFFDAMGQNAEYKDTFQHFEDARQLRDSNAYGTRQAYGVEWVEYRGADDGTTVSVPDGECRIFVRGIPDLFEHYLSPGESMDHVGAQGQRVYANLVPDRDRNEYVEFDVSSYPSLVCTTPASLRRGNA